MEMRHGMLLKYWINKITKVAVKISHSLWASLKPNCEIVFLSKNNKSAVVVTVTHIVKTMRGERELSHSFCSSDRVTEVLQTFEPYCAMCPWKKSFQLYHLDKLNKQLWEEGALNLFYVCFSGMFGNCLLRVCFLRYININSFYGI